MRVIILLTMIGILCLGCVPKSEMTVTSVIVNTDGEKIGVAYLKDVSEGVEVILTAEGISEGEHGFHVHEIGKCEAPDFKSAGTHWGEEHEDFEPGHHGIQLGDLPNLEALPNGKVTATHIVPKATLRPGMHSLRDADGSALIIHEKPDDYSGEELGRAGARIACGIIH